MTMTALVVQRGRQTLSGVSHLLLIDDCTAGAVTHTRGFTPRSLRPAWDTPEVQDLPGLQKETMSPRWSAALLALTDDLGKVPSTLVGIPNHV